MKKTNHNILYSIIVGFLLYIVNLLFSSIAFIDVNTGWNMVFVVNLILFGCLILFLGLQYNCKSLTQKIPRFFIIMFFYLCFFIFGAYLGVTRWYYDFFPSAKFPSNNNVSGLLSLFFFFAIIISGFLMILFPVLWKIIKKVYKKIKKIEQ